MTLTNVDLANVDALLLRPPQLTGHAQRLGTVTGTTDAPQVQGRVARRAQGGFQQYRYDSFGGTVNYSRRRPDASTRRLQQNPTTYLTAKGYRADGAVQGGAMAEARARRTARTVAPGRPDRPPHREHADRPRSGAGLHHGADQRHRARCRRRSTSPARRPTRIRTAWSASTRRRSRSSRPASRYSNLQGTIDLQPDKVHIDAHLGARQPPERAVDSPATWRSTSWQVGGVELFVTANDFKVIDNKMGNVRVNSNLEIARRAARAAHRRRFRRSRPAAINLDRDPRARRRLRARDQRRPST